MSRFRTILALALSGLFLEAGAQSIDIGSFDGSRSRAPFASATGALGYARLRASLTDPNNFGPNGIVRCGVNIAPGTPAITGAYLADKEVFFTSVFTGVLSATEAAAIQAFVGSGGVVITDCDSIAAEQAAMNSLLAALGSAGSGGPATGCSQTSTAGTILGGSSAPLSGPFGTLTGTIGTSVVAFLTVPLTEVTLVTCGAGGLPMRAFIPPGVVGAGCVMYGGDPHAFDLFTSTGGSLYNPNNELMYLNLIAKACGCAVTAACVSYGQGGCPGTNGVPALGCQTPPRLGAQFDIFCGNSSNLASSGNLLIGLAPANIPTPFPGCDVLVSILVALPVSLGPHPGGTVVSFFLPDVPNLCGVEAHAQTAILDIGVPRLFALSDGLRVLIGR